MTFTSRSLAISGHALLVVSLNVTPMCAAAQTVLPVASAQTRVGGSVPGVCRIAAPVTLSSTNARFIADPTNGGQITINQLASSVNGIAQPAQISLSFAALCNVSHTMVVRSVQGGLTRQEGGVGGNFASRVDYQLNARWAGNSVSGTFAGSAGALSMAVADGAQGNLELDLQTNGGDNPLAQGRYTDQVVVELTAAS
jgi:hypothetical protein